MNQAFTTNLPIVPSLLCLLLVVAFWWPAWRWLSLWQSSAEQPCSQRIAMAFVVAFGAFSLLTGPMLLLHASAQTAMLTVVVVWITAAVAAEILRLKKSPSRKASTIGEVVTPPVQHRVRGFFPALLFGLAAATSLALDLIPSKIALGLIGLSFAVNLFMLRRRQHGPLAIPEKTHPLVSTVFVVLLAAAMVTPAFHHRADADDNLYLSEALLLQDAPAMGHAAPTHRGEALPPNPVYAWQSFELWGAMLARYSELHSLIVLRSLVGPILLLLSLAFYAAFLRRMLPGGLVPVAMVFLVAYFLFGTSSHWTPNNYLLTRPQQGKTWLMHLGVLAILWQSMQYWRSGQARDWILLLLVSAACMGWAPTALLLVPAALGTFALVQLIQKPNLNTLKRCAVLGLCMAPQLVFVLYLRLQENQSLQDATLGEPVHTSWPDLFFFIFLKLRSGGGALEIFALLGAPLLLVLFPKNRRQAYPILFLGGLALLLLNPLFFGFLSELAGGKWGYLRLFWLLPLPLLFAALGACVYGSCITKKGSAWISLLSMGFLLGAMPLCGAHYVWSSSNLYSPEDKGIVLYEVENPYKVPRDLLLLANELQQLPLGPKHRILAHLNEVTHFAPLVKAFDFVYARDFQTPPPLIALGRGEEAKRRERLAFEFLAGNMKVTDAAPLLQSELATYVIVSPSTADLSISLSSLNYSLRFGSGPYELWVRD